MRLHAKVCGALAGLGLLGAASLLLAPVELLVPGAARDIPRLALRAAAMVQPAVLVLVAVAVGCATAPRVGLRAPLLSAWVSGAPAGAIGRGMLLPVIGSALATAVVLLGYAWLSEAHFSTNTTAPGFGLPLLTRILYGGIAEELMMRWGLMSVLVWCIWRVGRRPSPVPASHYWIGITLAACVFAIGHLPLLMALQATPTLGIVVLVVIGNAVPGMIFGWLFLRHGIEAAIAAHGLAHVMSAVASPLFA